MTIEFSAFDRATQGTGASRRLRLSGRVPGIVYGGTSAPKNVEFDHNALWHALKKEEFHSSILNLTVGAEKGQVLLRDVQYHPFKQLVLHIDFQRVDPNQKIHMKVPLHFSGQENSPAVKVGKALVSHVMTEVEVSCLPKDLPQFIAVDLSALELGHSFHTDDMTLPAGVTLVLGRNQKNPAVANAAPPKEVDDTATAAPAAADVPASAQKAPADAKAPGAKPAAKPAAKK